MQVKPQMQWDQVAASAIVIAGAPRSGTSWLGKLFSAHPDVLYRHEPDCFDGVVTIPMQDALLKIKPPFTTGEELRRLMRGWVRQRALRASAKRPLFAKSWRTPRQQWLRDNLANALLLLARSRLIDERRLWLPDFINEPARVQAVIKLVGWNALLPIAAVLPRTRNILLVRHPCGQVASMLRGIKQGDLDTGGDFALDPRVQKFYQRTVPTPRRPFDCLPLVERLTWAWLEFNDVAMRQARHNPANTRIVQYETFCRWSDHTLRELFEFTGLSWCNAVGNFLSASIGKSDGKYYGVFRDPAVAAERWRTELSEAHQRAIIDTVRLVDWTKDMEGLR